MAGRDPVCAGAGNDYVGAGSAADRVFGGPGRNRLLGRGGPDLLKGGAGNEVLKGSRGADSLRGGAGFGHCRGGAGVDSIHGCERKGTAATGEVETWLGRNSTSRWASPTVGARSGPPVEGALRVEYERHPSHPRLSNRSMLRAIG